MGARARRCASYKKMRRRAQHARAGGRDHHVRALNASVMCVTGSTATKSRPGGAYTTRRSHARSAASRRGRTPRAGEAIVATPGQPPNTLSIAASPGSRGVAKFHGPSAGTPLDGQLRRVVAPDRRARRSAASSPRLAGRTDASRARTETACRRCSRSSASRRASRRVVADCRDRTTASRGTATATLARRRRGPCARARAARPMPTHARHAICAASRRHGSRADGRRSCASSTWSRAVEAQPRAARCGSSRERADSRRRGARRRPRGLRRAWAAARRDRAM